MNLSQAAKTALEPFVGPTVADTCVRATALSVGKMSDELNESDMPALESNIRRLLGPVAPVAAIDTALATVRMSLTGVA